MKVFISWSGDYAKAAALVLREWLPSVIQSVEAWVSHADIDAGARWALEIGHQLEETKFGIICLTRENQKSPWLMYEAGALAKALSDPQVRVCPYLLGGMEPGDVERGPLSELQHKRANRADTLELVTTINKLIDPQLPDAQLKSTFKLWWPELDKRLAKLPKQPTSTTPARKTEDKIDEMLGLLRGLARRDRGRLTTADLFARRHLASRPELREDLLRLIDAELRGATVTHLMPRQFYGVPGPHILMTDAERAAQRELSAFEYEDENSEDNLLQLDETDEK